MSSSLYGAGGFGVVATTATAVAPQIGYTAAAAGAVAADGKAFNAMVISHTGTTDGSTANTTDWLAYKVTDNNGQSFIGVLLPGKERAVKFGFNNNQIARIDLWTLAPGGASAGGNNVFALVSGMVAI